MDVPGLRIVEKVRENSRMEIWKAFQVSLNRHVIVQRLRPEVAALPAEADAFLNLARAMSRIKHDSLVQVIDISTADGQTCLVLEHVAGPSLAEILKSGPLAPRKAAEIARQVADVLGIMWHRARLLHLNIKPDVLFLDENGTVKLCDLGLARAVPRGQTHLPDRGDTIAGTPNYMSPEQGDFNRPIDLRADMYSLGATLYHLLTGLIPFGGDDPLTVIRRHRHDFLANPRDVMPAVPPALAVVTSRLMMKQPEDRPPTWDAAVKELDKVARGGVIVPRQRMGAVSTVARASGLRTTDEKPSRSPEAGPPAWLRFTAWTALGIIWGAIVWIRVDPAHERHFRANLRHCWTRLFPQGAVGATTQPSVKAPAAVATTAVPVQNEPTATSIRDPVLDDALLAIARLLADQGVRPALQQLAQARTRWPSDAPQQARLDEARTILEEALHFRAYLRTGLANAVGQTCDLTLSNLSYRVRMDATSDDKVRAVVAADSPAGRPGDVLLFTIDQLAPAEMSRWLGTADTPGKAVMKFILYYRMGQRDAAATFAGAAGALAGALQDVARADSPATTP